MTICETPALTQGFTVLGMPNLLEPYELHRIAPGSADLMVAGSTGVVLQKRAAYFSLDPAHPNCVAPGKTPLHEWNELARHAPGVTIDARTGVRCGGCDPRSEGAAIGY